MKKTISPLERECEVLTSYLIDRTPDSYIKKKYLEGNKFICVENNSDFLDSLLIKIAHRGSFLIKLADAYTSLFYRKSLLRKKLMLLVAILECTSSTYNALDSVNETSKLCFFIRIIQKIAVFLFMLFISTIAFMPIHVISKLRIRTSNNL